MVPNVTEVQTKPLVPGESQIIELSLEIHPEVIKLKDNINFDFYASPDNALTIDILKTREEDQRERQIIHYVMEVAAEKEISKYRNDTYIYLMIKASLKTHSDWDIEHIERIKLQRKTSGGLFNLGFL